jgi:CheY-like chemotaxis protein
VYQKLESLKATFQLSRLLSEGEFVGVGKLSDAMEFIGTIAGVDRAYLGRWKESEKTMTIAAQWCIQQLEPMRKDLVFLGDISLIDEYFGQNSGMFAVRRELVICEYRLVGVLCLESQHFDTSLDVELQRFLAAAVQMLAPFLSNVALPAVSSTAQVEVSQEDASTSAIAKNASRVLIVEDNNINQKSLSMLWKNFGIDTQLAKDGFEALTLCRKHKYDLILMDLSMPSKDGFDTSREILTSCPNNQNTPIVAVTANVEDGVEARCLKTGMSEYVSKPIRIDRVRQLVEKYMSV